MAYVNSMNSGLLGASSGKDAFLKSSSPSEDEASEREVTQDSSVWIAGNPGDDDEDGFANVPDAISVAVDEPTSTNCQLHAEPAPTVQENNTNKCVTFTHTISFFSSPQL